MNISEGVLAVWAVIGLLALGRAWGDPARRRLIIGTAALVAATAAAATGLWHFAHDPHEWAEAVLALGGTSALIALALFASRGGVFDDR